MKRPTIARTRRNRARRNRNGNSGSRFRQGEPFARTMNSIEEKNLLLQRLGERVKALRNAANLTIKELAKRADLSLRFVNQLEAGQGNISVAGLARVASALGRPLPELILPLKDDYSIRARLWHLLSTSSDEELR